MSDTDTLRGRRRRRAAGRGWTILVVIAAVAVFAGLTWFAVAVPREAPAASLSPRPSASESASPSPSASAETSLSDTLDGQRVRLEMPASGFAVGFAVIFPDAGQSLDAALASSGARALLDSGWAVASSDFHGTNWGSPASSTDLVNLLEWAQPLAGVSASLFVSQGMGASTSVSAMARGQQPLACWYSVSPIVDLTSVESVPGVADQIGTAWGRSPEPDENPIAVVSSLPPGTVFRLAVGSEEGAIAQEPNTVALEEALGEAGATVSVLTWEGSDEDRTLWDAADLTDFAGGCVA